MDIYVRQGDSLWYYSQIFGINLQLILDSNREIQPNQLSADKEYEFLVLFLRITKLNHGDSFWRIAQSRNLKLDALLLTNPAVNPNRLQVGQTIKVHYGSPGG